MTPICLAVCLSLIPASTATEHRNILDLRSAVERAVESNGRFAPGQSTPAVQSRDSLMDGTILGAAVVGISVGVFAAVACGALSEEHHGSCWPSVLGFAAVGAGIGAAAGLGLDALRSQGPARPQAGTGASSGRRVVITWRVARSGRDAVTRSR